MRFSLLEEERSVDADADVVVAGAGHNSLIAACYLAKAGYRCLVLDARDIPGGGATTEEILLPGYHVDTCATGHTLIRVNPLLTRDEPGPHTGHGPPSPVTPTRKRTGGCSPTTTR